MKFRDDVTDKGFKIEYLTEDGKELAGIIKTKEGKIFCRWDGFGRPLMNERAGNLIGIEPKVYATSRHAVMHGYMSRALKENDDRENCLGYLEVSYYDNGTWKAQEILHDKQ